MAQPMMPMAPLPPLSKREIVILKDWIDRGASSARPRRRGLLAFRLTQAMAGTRSGSSPTRCNSGGSSKSRCGEIRLASTPPGRKIPWIGSSKRPWTPRVRTPAPAADRVTLIRRAYLDLSGSCQLRLRWMRSLTIARRAPTRIWSSGSWLLRTMERDGHAFGWTWFASPRAPASSMTRARHRLAVSRLRHQAVE
jgi:hypothetical protein